MMKLLVALACLALARAAPASIGRERCMWGPSFWCSSPDAALLCGATAHCQRVWGGSAPAAADQPEPLKDGLCTICEFIVSEATKLVENNATEQKIEDFLEQACRIIPDQGLQADCKSAIEEFTPTIINLIFNKLDPKTICTTIALCSTAQQEPAAAKVGDACSNCEAAAKKLIDFVSENTTEAEIEKFLNETLCDQLGGLDDLCKQVVMAYVPEIIDLLKNDLDPDSLCQLLGFCSSDVRAALAARLAKKGVNGGPLCAICEFVMRELEGMIEKNSTEAEVTKALDTVCSLLPGSITAECKSFVNEYAPAIITLLVNELDPKMVCSILTLC